MGLRRVGQNRVTERSAAAPVSMKMARYGHGDKAGM